MAVSHILGFPRMGADRQLKRAVEDYWNGNIDLHQLQDTGYELRRLHWRMQSDAGLDWVTVGDFSWYDQVLDHSAMFGVVPPRFGKATGSVDLDTIFRMGRGRAPTGPDAAPCAMTKWFDTNYHYLVPEFDPRQTFQLSTETLFDQITEAKTQGFSPKPVLLGPLTYLWLGRTKEKGFNKLDLLDGLLPVYSKIFARLESMGVEWLQMDEPILALDLPLDWREAFESVYHHLSHAKIKCLLTTYFGGLHDNLSTVIQLPVEGIHIDCVRAPQQLTTVVDRLSAYKILSCGVIDGRNIWKSDLHKIHATLETVRERLGERLWVSSSCSLLHCPVDLDQETKLDSKIRSWLSFAKQKISEVVVLTRALNEGLKAVEMAFKDNAEAIKSRKNSPQIHKPDVQKRVSECTDSMAKRQSPYSKRAQLQRKHLKLPMFPTTTIGSFPQTSDIRRVRQQFKKGEMDQKTYIDSIQLEIKNCIHRQEALGLDVLVHGEAERNDMVEYFGELLEGVAFTQNGWVQSYGSRCVKPPIIYGDIRRPKPMTVNWSRYAKSQTRLPMKGMLTGPVTILCWSFVRDDQPREKTALQLALALRDEVVDLEKAGIGIIQIDEPAFREGMPLLKAEQIHYLDWAVKVFKIAVCGVQDATQIHTHMCYSEFNEVIEYIAAMDADVITIESSRSAMELLSAFVEFSYPNEIGPGIYDIHSPRVPTVNEMVQLIRKACERLPAERLWVNPDCGLKTRGWEEVEQALSNMVQAAKVMRQNE